MTTEAIEAVPTDPAYIEAVGLSLTTREGPVFSDVSLEFGRGAVACLVGRAGSGRSALLLAIAGRLRGWTGSLRVGGLDADAASAQVRQLVSVARIDTLVDQEKQLSVSDSVVERALIDGIDPEEARRRLADIERVLGVRLPPDELVGRLSAVDQTLLCVALALLKPADAVVLDDADRDLDAQELRELGAALRRLADQDITVVVSVHDPANLPPGAQVHRLAPPRPALATGTEG